MHKIETAAGLADHGKKTGTFGPGRAIMAQGINNAP